MGYSSKNIDSKANIVVSIESWTQGMLGVNLFTVELEAELIPGDSKHSQIRDGGGG